MDVVIDTNIFQANFSLKSLQMEALTAYLEKTDKHLILPYVVANELIINYRKELKKSINDLQTIAKDFHNCVTTPEYEAVSKAIKGLQGRNNEKFDTESKNYIAYIKKEITRVKEDPLPELDLKPIIDKALKKEKPFKLNGEGFKDTIIWESVLAHCRNNNLNSIIFISNNSQDFGKQELLPILSEQAKAENVDVYYYNSLDAFIQDRFESIRNISLTVADVEIDDLKLYTEFKLKEHKTDLEKIFEQKSTRNRRYSSFQGIHGFAIEKVEDIVVKDVAANFKYVQASLICNMGIVCVAEQYSEYTNPATGDYDYDVDIELDEITTECIIDISLKFADGVYEELQVSSITFP